MPRFFTAEARAARHALFEVDVRGEDAISELLRKAKLFTGPTRRTIERAGTVARKTAQRAAKPHDADKGTLGRTIRLEIRDRGLTAWVYPARSLVGLAFTIEEGRRPGRRPPYGAIKRWMIAHGIISGARGDSKLVREMQERIKAEGTRGVHFMAAADNAATTVLRDGIPRTEAEVKALWERGG